MQYDSFKDFLIDLEAGMIDQQAADFYKDGFERLAIIVRSIQAASAARKHGYTQAAMAIEAKIEAHRAELPPCLKW